MSGISPLLTRGLRAASQTLGSAYSRGGHSSNGLIPTPSALPLPREARHVLDCWWRKSLV